MEAIFRQQKYLKLETKTYFQSTKISHFDIQDGWGLCLSREIYQGIPKGVLQVWKV